MKQDENIFTVTDLSNAIKMVVENSFAFVKVKGEISGFKKAASGHTYFSLKDENSVINAIAWKGVALPAQMADGLEVVCCGKITTFAGNSRYQIVATSIEVSGVGALLKILEELKLKLKNEGLFDEKYKKNIPFLPKTIGVVTSPTGAVIRDIIHRVRERFPSNILLYPVAVQGDGAAVQIIKAIQFFNNAINENRPEVIIVARGGGSLEDLWCFNDENLVREVFASKIPIISAVGHETDTTLIDFVADLRAPTPTGAAEKAVPVHMDLLASISDINSRIISAVAKYIEIYQNKIIILDKSLPDLAALIDNFYQRLDFKCEIIDKKFINIFANINARFDIAARMLESLSYKNILNKGFVMVMDNHNNPVTSALSLPVDKSLNLTFHDGKVSTIVNNNDITYSIKNKVVKKSSKSKFNSNDNQGSLF